MRDRLLKKEKTISLHKTIRGSIIIDEFNIQTSPD